MASPQSPGSPLVHLCLGVLLPLRVPLCPPVLHLLHHCQQHSCASLPYGVCLPSQCAIGSFPSSRTRTPSAFPSGTYTMIGSRCGSTSSTISRSGSSSAAAALGCRCVAPSAPPASLHSASAPLATSHPPARSSIAPLGPCPPLALPVPAPVPQGAPRARLPPGLQLPVPVPLHHLLSHPQCIPHGQR